VLVHFDRSNACLLLAFVAGVLGRFDADFNARFEGLERASPIASVLVAVLTSILLLPRVLAN
jgi:hypothetical protein